MQRNTSVSALGIALRLAACGFAFAPTSIIAASDCSPWDTAIGQPGMNAAIWALAAQPNGELIAGGAFTSAGGTNANHIARWDGQQWHALGDGVNGSVVALATLPNGDVVAGGSFTVAGEQPANRIARWDGRNWHALGSGVNGSVRALTVGPNGDLVAAGAFTTAGGIAANHIARWDGTQWHTLSDGVDGVVHALELFDDGDGLALYAGGDFLNAGGVEVNHIAKWDGATWSPLDVGVDGRVTVLQAMHVGESPVLYVAGKTLSAAGYAPLFMGMARWDGSTREWSPDGDGLRGEVRAMTVFDDGAGPAVFAATTIEGSGISHLTRWDGQWWKPVAEPVDGVVYALGINGQGENASWIAAGSFDMAGGEGAGNIARWQSCPEPSSTIRHVPGEYVTIQSAIEAAMDGDIVLVASGKYKEAIDYLGKSIALQSEDGAEQTIIDATGLDTTAVLVASGEGSGTLLRGFSVTGGVGTDGAPKQGGGIKVTHSTLTIDSCILVDNGTGSTLGGGLAAGSASDVLAVNCTFVGNEASGGGGAAVFGNHHARFINCIFDSNAAMQSGGGVSVAFNYGHATFSNCVFQHNTNLDKWSFSSGLGLAAGHPVTVENCLFLHHKGQDHQGQSVGFGGGAAIPFGVVRHCQFIGNSAFRGGGLNMSGLGHGAIINCRFEGNFASDRGGGIHIHVGSPDWKQIGHSYFCNNLPQHVDGPHIDLGGNTFAESCESTPGDLNGDGAVDVADLLLLLAAWGDCPTGGMPVPPCLADLNGDGFIDVADLLTLLANWG